MAKNKTTYFEKLAYRFDNAMSRGLIAIVSLLTVATLLFAGIVSAVVSAFNLVPPAKDMDFFEIYWAAILRTLDAGTMGNDEGFGFRFAMFIVTIAGVIVVASLIGAISNAFSSKIEKLRKGKSRVIETGHTLILGWNSKIFSVIKEIQIANQSEKGSAIVVLADRDKVWMEDEIHANCKSDGNTRIVVRSGSPLGLSDVLIGSPYTSRGVIILSPEDEEDADSMSIKTCLALLRQSTESSRTTSIVAEIKDEENLEAGKLVGGNAVTWINARDLISRLIVQTCRQSGLSSVFTELLDFEGSEIYLADLERFSGRTFAEVAMALEKGCALGVLEGTEVFINPDPSRVVSSETRLIVIAEDDSQILFGQIGLREKSSKAAISRDGHHPEKTLILGINESIIEILEEMSRYMPKGSETTVVSHKPISTDLGLVDFKLNFIQGDHTSRNTLEKLSLESYDHIIVLAESADFSIQHCDSRTLLALLHLRDLAKLQGLKLNIVSEMLDDRNRQLAESTDADDFIVSDKLVSLMIAQISQNPNLSPIFAQLLSSEGSEIRLHPVEWYLGLDQPANFNEIVSSALDQNETAIGYQLQANRDSDSRLHGLTLNPTRTEMIRFRNGDKIAVVTQY